MRRSANTIRITAQLINAVTGFHLWSKTYDRDLGDVLKLQTEIATAVASALKVTLLGDVAAKVELGGTGNPAAFDAYLRGAKAYSSALFTNLRKKTSAAAIAAYTEAIRLDPHYALAFAARSTRPSPKAVAAEAETAAAVREGFDKAQADARQARARAPALAQAHHALAAVAEIGTLNFTQANGEEYERALSARAGQRAEVLRAKRRICSSTWAALRCGRCGRSAASSCSTGSLAEAIPCSAGRCMRPAAMRRRWRHSQKSSVLTLASRRPTGNAGSPITGSGILSAHALHARRSRTTGRVKCASR